LLRLVASSNEQTDLSLSVKKCCRCSAVWFGKWTILMLHETNRSCSTTSPFQSSLIII